MRIRDHRKRVARRGWLNSCVIPSVLEWNAVSNRWKFSDVYWNKDHWVKSDNIYARIMKRKSLWTL